MNIATKFRNFELRTRPVLPESKSALDRRWLELPDSAKTPNQILGRFAVGCEGTHGVFPKCNLTCSPCYHSADANKVRTDGQHTLNEVSKQMAFLKKVRGPRAHAQLIGGEVSLLSANDHANALLAMRALGREPMSMTHGDFDYSYLKDLALDQSGKVRFQKLSFAAHFDSLMRGRRGAIRPKSEEELNFFRLSFALMFHKLKKEHGVSFYLAHNMTVTPSNLLQVHKVVESVVEMPFNMLSFQPAAFVGDHRRWRENFKTVSIDDVWNEIQDGVGYKLPWQAIQFGDPRCNRTCVAIKIKKKIIPLLDPQDPADLKLRDIFLDHFSGVILGGTPPMILGIKLLRLLLKHPSDSFAFSSHVRRLVIRSGGFSAVLVSALKGEISIKTFVVHNFMDATDVAPAWELMEKGIESKDPKIKEVQDRLRACTYTMSHPESGRLIPACVQHSVLDPAENIALKRLLPIIDKRSEVRT